MSLVANSWRSKASRGAPRLLALLWAVYAASRALAYVDTSPRQLDAVSSLVPLWLPWAVVALMLVLGGCVPARADACPRIAARSLRQWGMTGCFALLLMWGGAFIVSDFARGWVTAGSYVMLAVFALVSGFFASREVASVYAVREEVADAGLGNH